MLIRSLEIGSLTTCFFSKVHLLIRTYVVIPTYLLSSYTYVPSHWLVSAGTNSTLLYQFLALWVLGIFRRSKNRNMPSYVKNAFVSDLVIKLSMG